VKAVLCSIPAIAALVVLATGAGAGELANKPGLRVQIGTHNADLTGLAVDRHGDLLATSSFDKTLRVLVRR
jgi:hypothetical protein